MGRVPLRCIVALVVILGQAAVAQETDPSPETASDPDADPGTLEEIVVSGHRRLDTPLQAQAVSATALDEGIFRNAASTSRLDVLRSVAGVTVLNLGSRSTVVIRGASTAPDGDPNGAAAASYIGDVALSGLSGSRENVDLSNYDIERIEVLRGPQGFTYGAGAVSGVVRTIPKPADPSQTTGGVASAFRHVEHGDDPGYEFDGHVNVPLVQDVLGLRVTAYANREENPIWSTLHDEQAAPSSLEGARLSLRYVPIDALTVDARFVYERNEPFDITRTANSLGDYQSSDPREWTRRTTRLGWINADWDLGFATATWVGSYLSRSTPGVFPGLWGSNAADGAAVESRNSDEQRNDTQELRLAHADGIGLDWTVGAYYERRRTETSGYYYVVGTDVPGSIEYDFDGIDDPDVSNETGSAWDTSERQVSGFGELTYWFADTVGVSVAARYLEQEGETGYAYFSEGVPDAPPDMVDTFPGAGDWWGKADVTWKRDDDELYYVRYSEVTRPGGTNYAALNDSCPPEFAALVQEFFPGDQMRTLEAGAKVSPFDGRATINAAAYKSKWQDAPVYTGVLCGNGINYYIDNAGTIDLYGVELDAQARLGEYVSASLSAAWAVAEIVEVGPTFTGGIEGDRMPGNPEWKVSGSVDYQAPLTQALELFAGVGFSYTGSYNNGLSADWSTYAAFATFPGLDVEVIGTLPGGADLYSDPGSGDYTLFDARVGLEADRWTLTLFGDNLTNSNARSLINYINLTTAGEATITRVTPRTLGLRLEWRF